MNKGERIWKSLLDLERDYVAVTKWLLLYIIKRNRTTVQIQDEITNLWIKINVIVPSFYLVFPSSNGGHNQTPSTLEDELMSFKNMGIIVQHDGKWSLTRKGNKVLDEWRPRIQKIVTLFNF